MSTNTSNLGFLAGAAGKDNNDTGNKDYFQPGTHKVQITKIEAGASKKEPSNNLVAIEAIVVEGGVGILQYKDVDGKITKLQVPETIPAPHKGRKQSQVLKQSHPRFHDNLGNFALAAKKTFMAAYLAAEAGGPDSLGGFLKNKGYSPDNERLKKFVARGKENPNATTDQDIFDVVEMDLPVGLVMTIAVRQHLNLKGLLTGVSVWSAGSVADLGLLPNDDD